MIQLDEIKQLAKDRPTSIGDDLYQWSVDAEEMLWKLAALAQPVPKRPTPATLLELHTARPGSKYYSDQQMQDYARAVKGAT